MFYKVAIFLTILFIFISYNLGDIFVLFILYIFIFFGNQKINSLSKNLLW